MTAAPGRAFGPAEASRRWWVVLAVLVVASVALYARRPADRVAALDGATMGTTWRIAFAEPLAPTRAAALRDSVEALLALLNARLSTYDTASELVRLNRLADTTALRVSDDLHATLRVARRVHVASDGAFDPTVGPLVDAWGFGPSGRPTRTPGAAVLEALRAQVGFDRLAIGDDGTVRKRHPDVALDLSAVAKGHAVDRVAALVAAADVGGALVEIGGEVRATGRAAGGRPFRVGIEAPDPDSRRVAAAVALEDAALATSGNYRNRFTVDGVTYAHTLDPRSGRPVVHALLSASVIAPTCAEADAWATALMVLGPDSAWSLATRADLAVLLLVDAPGDSVEYRATPAFRRAMLPPAPATR